MMRAVALQPVFAAAVALCAFGFVNPALADSSQPYYSSDTGQQVVVIQSPIDSTVNQDASSNKFFKVLSDLPHYTRDAVIDPHPAPVNPSSNPALAEIPHPFKSFGVGTRTGFDVGLQVSDYKYREGDLDVTLSGLKGGVHVLMTGKPTPNFFLTGDFRYALGSSDYSSWATVASPTSSGTANGKFESIWDLRGLAGYDFILTSSYDISPFTGIAYRNLYSDSRGITSLGLGGYRRNNDLFYMPFGITQRVMLTPEDRLDFTVEYDQVLLGVQRSYLSDANVGYPDINNLQKSGRGLRAELTWEKPSWSFGPYANYWNIDSSTIKSACGTGFCLSGEEPHNHTYEAGVEVKYHFFGF